MKSSKSRLYVVRRLSQQDRKWIRDQFAKQSKEIRQALTEVIAEEARLAFFSAMTRDHPERIQ